MNQPSPPCKSGDRIELLSMPNDPDPVPTGSTGTVIGDPVWFQNSWAINIDWDIPRSLSLCSPPDRFRVITE